MPNSTKELAEPPDLRLEDQSKALADITNVAARASQSFDRDGSFVEDRPDPDPDSASSSEEDSDRDTKGYRSIFENNPDVPEGGEPVEDHTILTALDYLPDPDLNAFLSSTVTVDPNAAGASADEKTSLTDREY
ncbi:hypothetical protein OC846_006827, partial [Tilletia horrida]